MLGKQEIRELKKQSIPILKRMHEKAEKDNTLSSSDLGYLWNLILIKQRKENSINRLQKKIEKYSKHIRP